MELSCCITSYDGRSLSIVTRAQVQGAGAFWRACSIHGQKDSMPIQTSNHVLLALRRKKPQTQAAYGVELMNSIHSNHP